MKSLISLGCGLAMFQTTGHAAIAPQWPETAALTCRRLSSEMVRQELRIRLSDTTSIFGSDDGRYETATSRWNRVAVPGIEVIIEPGQESDIPTVVSRPLSAHAFLCM